MRKCNCKTASARPSFADTINRANIFHSSEPERLYKQEEVWDDQDDSSACSDASLTDFTMDDDGKWHTPPKNVWKATVEVSNLICMVFLKRNFLGRI